MMVTRLAWMAQRLVSSKRWTRKASDASCKAWIACDCHLISSSRGLKVNAISRTCARKVSHQRRGLGTQGWRSGVEQLTRRAKGSLSSSRSVLCWYLRISLNALVPGRYLYFLPRGTGSPAVRNKSDNRGDSLARGRKQSRATYAGCCLSLAFLSPHHPFWRQRLLTLVSEALNR